MVVPAIDVEQDRCGALVGAEELYRRIHPGDGSTSTMSTGEVAHGLYHTSSLWSWARRRRRVDRNRWQPAASPVTGVQSRSAVIGCAKAHSSFGGGACSWTQMLKQEVSGAPVPASYAAGSCCPAKSLHRDPLTATYGGAIGTVDQVLRVRIELDRRVETRAAVHLCPQDGGRGGEGVRHTSSSATAAPAAPGSVPVAPVTLPFTGCN